MRDGRENILTLAISHMYHHPQAFKKALLFYLFSFALDVFVLEFRIFMAEL